jgi:predicted sulfurtransferase
MLELCVAMWVKLNAKSSQLMDLPRSPSIFQARRCQKGGSDSVHLSCACDPSDGTVSSRADFEKRALDFALSLTSQVLLFYRYYLKPPRLPGVCNTADLKKATRPTELAKVQHALASRLGLSGKIRVGHEGFNITVAGRSESVQAYMRDIVQHPMLVDLGLEVGTERADLFFKPSPGCVHVFDQLSVKVVDEICPFGQPHYTPRAWIPQQYEQGAALRQDGTEARPASSTHKRRSTKRAPTDDAPREPPCTHHGQKSAATDEADGARPPPVGHSALPPMAVEIEGVRNTESSRALNREGLPPMTVQGEEGRTSDVFVSAVGASGEPQGSNATGNTDTISHHGESVAPLDAHALQGTRVAPLDAHALQGTNVAPVDAHALQGTNVAPVDAHTLPGTGEGVQYLSPAAFHRLMEERDGSVVVLDTRNYYESMIGHFPDAVRPAIRKFGTLAPWLQAQADRLRSKRVVTYCTGGIRCEKAAAYLQELLGAGPASSVATLDGGIQNYLAWVDSEWAQGRHVRPLFLGRNYVFDARQSLGTRATAADPVSACIFCHARTSDYTKCSGQHCHLLIVSCRACTADRRVTNSLFCCDACAARTRTQAGPGLCTCEQARQALLSRELAGDAPQAAAGSG